MKRQKPTHTAVRVPLGPYEPGEEAWYEHVDSQVYAFVAPASTLHPESVARTLLCLNVCADLVWEWRVGPPSWRSLRIPELWGRLERQERAFPQPELVLAFYETLSAFLPWLVRAGELASERCAIMLAELEQVKNPLHDEARARLAARSTQRQRPFAWPPMSRSH